MTRRNKTAVLPDRAQAEKIYLQLLPRYESVLNDLQQRLYTLINNSGLSVTIKHRVKRFNNYCEKLVRISKLQGNEGLEITDLLGIRIICPFLEDLEKVEQMMGENFEILEMDHKAEQHSFREFGYDSVHLLIRTDAISDDTAHLPHSCAVCEVQLRTILQEAWAEVEHELVYKSDIDIPNHSIRRKLASLNASLTLSDLIFQEIRDGQKEIRQRGLKRRQTVESLACECGGIQISQSPDLTPKGSTLNLDIPDLTSSASLEHLMLSALEAHSNNQFQSAVDLYTLILKKNMEPRIRSLVYNHRGMALFALADYQKGVDDFSKAVEYNEDNARAWCNRGLALRVLRQFDQSLQDYARGIEISPQQYEGYWGRAQTYFEMKLYSQALRDCRKTLERNHDFMPALELERTVRRLLF